MTAWVKTNQSCLNCGSSRGLALAVDHEHCFKCGYHRNYNGFYISHAVSKDLLWTGYLPPTTNKIPINYRIWLEKYFTPDQYKQLGLLWSDEYNRLVLPVRSRDGTLTCYQMRSITHDPKWITVSPEYPWGHKYPWISEWGAESYVITEDILSALKVSFIHPTVSILGSSV